MSNHTIYKAFLYQNGEKLCEITQSAISDTLEHQYQIGSANPIMTWRTISMTVALQPIIALGVRHSIVVPFQNKNIPVTISEVTRSGTNFLVTGKLYE